MREHAGATPRFHADRIVGRHYAYAAATYPAIGLTNIADVSIGEISAPSRKAVVVEPCLNAANAKAWHRHVGYGTVGYVDGHAATVAQVTSIIETNAYYLRRCGPS